MNPGQMFRKEFRCFQFNLYVTKKLYHVKCCYIIICEIIFFFVCYKFEREVTAATCRTSCLEYL